MEKYKNYITFFRETFLAPLRKEEENLHKIEEGRKVGETELFWAFFLLLESFDTISSPLFLRNNIERGYSQFWEFRISMIFIY